MDFRGKDISELAMKSTISGDEKIPVSQNEFVTPSQIADIVTLPIYKQSSTRPDVPSDTTLPPEGWSLSPFEAFVDPDDVGDIFKTKYNGHSYYKIPGQGSSTMASCKIAFTTTYDNQQIGIEIVAFSEAGSDIIAVGYLDESSVNVSLGNNAGCVSGNGISSIVNIDVPTAGSHYVMVVYQKDGSVDAHGDYGLFRLLPLWMSISTIKHKKTVSCSAPVSVWDANSVGGNAKPGDNGKSAYELAVQQGFNGTLDEWLESLKGGSGSGTPGDDGRPGNWSSFVFKKSDTKPNTPTSTKPIPNGAAPNDGWVDAPDGAGKWWMSKATVDGVTGLAGKWSAPIPVTGTDGTGVDFKFAKHTSRTETPPIVNNSRNPGDNWFSDPPERIKGEFLWMTWAKVDSANNLIGVWVDPACVSGEDGAVGAPGIGRVIYPAGEYDISARYYSSDRMAPYVLDKSDNNYYILVRPGEWCGNQEQESDTPSSNVADGWASWIKMEAFEAIYAKIGIIANGLIGSAVFNGDYMFSQQGVTQNGTYSANYHLFLRNATNSGDVSDPYEGAFIPNIMFNFKTGAGHYAAGAIRFDKDGNVSMRDLRVKNAIISGYLQEEYFRITEWARILTIRMEKPNVLVSGIDSNQNTMLRIEDPDLIPGHPYNFSITNIGNWPVYIESWTGLDFLSCYVGGVDIDQVQTAMGLDIHYGRIAKLLFIPSRFDEEEGFWVGDFYLLNSDEFVYVPANKSYQNVLFKSSTMTSKVNDQVL